MQHTIRPWITAAVALAGAGVIVVTPAVTPNAEHHAVNLTSLDQDIANLEQILASLIDPSLSGEVSQSAATAAIADLTAVSSTTSATPSEELALLSTAFSDISSGLTTVGQAAAAGDPASHLTTALQSIPDTFSSGGAPEFVTAAQDAVDQAVTDLSGVGTDPIQGFEADLSADWTQLASGDIFSSTTIADLTATLNAAPAAAEEYIAELIDPAAAAQATAGSASGDLNAAADVLNAVPQQEDAIVAALAPGLASGATDSEIASAVNAAIPLVNAEGTDLTQAGTDVTNAIDALEAMGSGGTTSTATLADLGTDLGALWSDLWTALGL